MALKPLVVTFDGNIQRVSTLLTAAGLPTIVKTISFQPDGGNAAPSYIGGADVSNTLYGVYLPAAAATVPPAPFLWGAGVVPDPIDTQHIYIRGTNNEKLHLMMDT